MSEVAVKPFKIDINDPTAVLPDDEITLDPDADAFSGPPPVPDGTHLASLGLGQRGFQQGTTDEGINYVMAHIEARVIAEGEPFNNFPVFDTASTMVMESTGTSRIAGILGALSVKVPSRTTVKQLAQSLAKELEGRPQVKITTKWEGFCTDCENEKKPGKLGKVVVRGQRNFPEGKHVMECPNCGNQVSAQARITKYAPR